jgi:hypothetical protein
MSNKKQLSDKICPKCSKKHLMSGTFCSRKCANSRTFTKESREKTSESMKQFFSSISEEEKNKKLLLLEKMTKDSQIESLKRIMFQPWDTLGFNSKRVKVFLEQECKCNRCGISEWMGQQITLELEHKDGNKNNNSRENLEGLCPNCHSLTETWRGRKSNMKNKKILNKLDLLYDINVS